MFAVGPSLSAMARSPRSAKAGTKIATVVCSCSGRRRAATWSPPGSGGLEVMALIDLGDVSAPARPGPRPRWVARRVTWGRAGPLGRSQSLVAAFCADRITDCSNALGGTVAPNGCRADRSELGVRTSRAGWRRRRSVARPAAAGLARRAHQHLRRGPGHRPQQPDRRGRRRTAQPAVRTRRTSHRPDA
jgi:hypothetical protein